VEAGVLVGRAAAIRSAAGHPLARALTAGKLTRAALGATLRLYRDAERAERSVPLLRLLATPLENLRNRAERLATQVAASPLVKSAEASEGVTSISHAVVAAQQIRTWRVAIEPATMSAERFASRLRQAAPPVVAKLEADRVVLDLRSVFPRQDPQLAAAVSSLTEARGAAMASQPAE
jgi:L-seryl-tRNA(Ser) seleniumtransferase